jgi:hypothetical protein
MAENDEDFGIVAKFDTKKNRIYTMQDCGDFVLRKGKRYDLISTFKSKYTGSTMFVYEHKVKAFIHTRAGGKHKAKHAPFKFGSFKPGAYRSVADDDI